MGAVQSGRAPRDLWLGAPTVQSIIGQFAAPAFLDRYLARKAYEAQLSNDPVLPGDPDELFGPDDSDHGAHGRFATWARDSVAAIDSAQLRASAVVAGVRLLAGAFLMGRMSRASRGGVFVQNASCGVASNRWLNKASWNASFCPEQERHGAFGDRRRTERR